MEILSLWLHISDTSEISSGVVPARLWPDGSGHLGQVTGLVGCSRCSVFGSSCLLISIPGMGLGLGLQARTWPDGSGYMSPITGKEGFFGERIRFGLVGCSSSSVFGSLCLLISIPGMGSGSGLGLGLGLGLEVSERTSLTVSSSDLGGDLEMQGNCWWGLGFCFWVALFSSVLKQQPISFFVFVFLDEDEDKGFQGKGK